MFAINTAVAVILLLNETRQVNHQGWEYFTEFYNYLDLAGNGFVIAASIVMFRTDGNEFYEHQRNKTLLILGIMLIGLRACSSLTIFESYRVQIMLFKQVGKDIIPFLVIILILIFLTAIVYGVEVAMHEDPVTKVKSVDGIRNDFFINLGLFYQFMLGEIPYSEDSDFNTTNWIVYIVFTMLI